MSIVLLTGSTGFVGRQLLKALQERGYQIRLVIREGSQSRIANMEGIESIISTQNLFSESSDWWGKACDGVDAVIHSAWYAEPGSYLSSSKNIDCLIGTLNIAKGVSSSGVRRFIGIGTCFEYGFSNTPLSVNHPLKPLSIYARSKVATFLTLEKYFENMGVDFAWCRLFYLHGESEDSRRLIPYLHSMLSTGKTAELGDGSQVRDFLDVYAAAQEIIDICESANVGPYNICSGLPITIQQIAEGIADIYGRRDLLIFNTRKAGEFDPVYMVGVKNNALLRK